MASLLQMHQLYSLNLMTQEEVVHENVVKRGKEVLRVDLELEPALERCILIKARDRRDSWIASVIAQGGNVHIDVQSEM